MGIFVTGIQKMSITNTEFKLMHINTISNNYMLPEKYCPQKSQPEHTSVCKK